MTEIQKLLTDNFPEENIELNKVLAPMTYFKIGGPAEAYLEVHALEQLQKVLVFCKENSIKLTVLGGASNVIISDSGLSGLVISIKAGDVIDLDEKLNDKHLVEIEAGIKTALLVSRTVQMGFAGLEYFLGVPGTLGGAVYNNAHYLGKLIDAHIHEVMAVDGDGNSVWLDHKACDFAYEHSRFQKTKEIIWKVRFALKKGNKEESMARIKEATEYRANTQPLGLHSSGCIFQNVPNDDKLKQLFPQFAEASHVPGGFIIDQAGLKGLSYGDIEVSEKHAAWMINKGNGTADQVKNLIDEVKARVADKFGVELHEEVFFLK